MGTTAWGGLRERRMLALQVLVLVLAPLASSQPAPTSCCETKTVGGVSYTFVREDSAAISYSCLSPCVYERDDQPGTAFCFAQGDQQVVCGDSPGLEATTAPGGDDEVVTRVKSYIDSGTCARVSSSSSCGDSAESYFQEFVYKGRRIVVSNQVPDHPHEHDQVFTNPNEACERYQYISLPLQPAKGSSMQRTGMGSIGTAVTGAAFFNDWSDPNGKVAMSFEARSLDSCFGHSARQGSYHYHANINCTNAGSATGANDPDTCKMIGYYRDGVPVYGFCKDLSGMVMTSCYSCTGSCTSSVTHVSGTYTDLGANSDDYTYEQAAFDAGACNLDEANGAIHPTTGEYSYFMTTTYPWTPINYFGDQGVSSYCSAS